MPRYRYVGTSVVLVPDLHREIVPGEEFESELAFSPGDFELLGEQTLSITDPAKEA